MRVDQHKCFNPSLRLKDKKKGVVAGNLHWVCRFLNGIDRRHTNQYPDDAPVEMTTEYYNNYIGKI